MEMSLSGSINRGHDSESDSSDIDIQGESSTLVRGTGSLINSQHLTPKDRFKAVYLIFYLLGIGTLLPWNMFITAKQYFIYQLRNTTDPTSFNTAIEPLQINYESSVAIANMVPNIIMQVLNTLLAGKVSMSKRLIGSMITMIIMFIFTLVLTKVDVSNWQYPFFITTLVCVVIMSSASSLLTSSLFGLVGRFPPEYTQAIMGGMGLGGVFAAVADIITKSIGADTVDSAFYFFLSAVLVVVLALISYLFLYKLKYAQHHRLEYRKVLLESTNVAQESRYKQYSNVIKILWPYMMSVSLVFFVTLMLFPALTSSVESTVPYNERNMWQDKYWLDLYCFLMFNVGDLTGRTLSAWIHVPKSKVIVPILSWLRIVFIPLFVLCNAQPRNTLPVVFDNDVWPIVIMAVFSLTNGYISTQALMIAPSQVEKQQSELAGSMMAVFMTLGLSVGSLISPVVVQAVTKL